MLSNMDDWIFLQKKAFLEKRKNVRILNVGNYKINDLKNYFMSSECILFALVEEIVPEEKWENPEMGEVNIKLLKIKEEEIGTIYKYSSIHRSDQLLPRLIKI